MLKLYPLFSGSSGNSTYIEFENKKGILVDIGKSAKKIHDALRARNISVNNVEAIFITHEHTDHISGLKVFISKYNPDVKIFGSAGTIGSMRKSGYLTDKNNVFEIKNNQVDLEFVQMKSFSISHDCAEGLGYTFTSKSGSQAAICTDLGYISKDVQSNLKGSNVVVMESNHDVMMLQNGRYPYFLKRRILSDNGHLSNDTCGKFLPFLVKNGTKNIILSHLSEHNNIPDLALQTSKYYLEQEGIKSEKDFHLSASSKEVPPEKFYSIENTT